MAFYQIRPIARTVDHAMLFLYVVKGLDERDTTTFKSKSLKIKKIDKIKFGIVSVPEVDKRIYNLMTSFIARAVDKLKWSEKAVSLKYIDLAIQTYHPLVWTEFFSATRRMDGRRFGKKIEDSAGPEVLRRIAGGSEISKAEYEGQYYQKALEISLPPAILLSTSGPAESSIF